MKVFVVSVETTAGERSRIEHVCNRSGIELIWIDGSEANADVFPSPKLRARYVRVSLASLLPNDIDRVVYLDADTLIRSDLEPLFESNIGDLALMAVRDFRIPFVAAPLGPKNYAKLGISPTAPYFNSGVLLINLAAWRERDLEPRIVDYYQTWGFQTTLHDQEILNAVLHNEWSELDLLWNQQSVLFRPQAMVDGEFKSACLARADLASNPRIVHFTGGSKPWSYLCRHPFREQWHAAFRKSGWFSSPAEYSRWYLPFLANDSTRRLWSRVRRAYSHL